MVCIAPDFESSRYRAPMDIVELAPFGGISVLVIDDVDINYKVIDRILAPFGIDVTHASLGHNGVKFLHDSPHAFDLVLVDLVMPDFSGFDVLSVLREENGSEHLPPMVAYTASTDKAIEGQWIREGGRGMLRKPVSIASIHFLLSCLAKK